MKKKQISIFLICMLIITGFSTLSATEIKNTSKENKEITADAAPIKTTDSISAISNLLEVVIEPDSWNFGALPQGETDFKRFVIKYIGPEGVWSNIYLDTNWDDFWISGGGEIYLYPNWEESLHVYFSPKQSPGTTVYCYLTVDWWYYGTKYTTKASIQGTSKTRDRSIDSPLLKLFENHPVLLKILQLVLIQLQK